MMCPCVEYYSAMKKEGSPDTCCNLGHDAEGKKPHSRGHIPYDPISMKCPEQTNLVEGRFMGSYGGWGTGRSIRAARFHFGVLKMF